MVSETGRPVVEQYRITFCFNYTRRTLKKKEAKGLASVFFADEKEKRRGKELAVFPGFVRLMRQRSVKWLYI